LAGADHCTVRSDSKPTSWMDGDSRPHTTPQAVIKEQNKHIVESRGSPRSSASPASRTGPGVTSVRDASAEAGCVCPLPRGRSGPIAGLRGYLGDLVGSPSVKMQPPATVLPVFASCAPGFSLAEQDDGMGKVRWWSERGVGDAMMTRMCCWFLWSPVIRRGGGAGGVR